MTAPWTLTRARLDPYRTAMAVATAVLLGLAVPLFLASLGAFERVGYVGIDAIHYFDAARRFLATGSPYMASEVAGPFVYSATTFLHPPIALYLMVPFAFLPLAVWWAVPLAVVAWSVWTWRPAPWTWPLFALALAWPRFHGALIVGNTDLWVCAALCLGLRYGWPALLIVIKPSLGFLVLAGAWSRSWWYGLPVLALLALPFGALWVDWAHVVLNSPGDLTYSLPNVLWVAMPAVGWWSTRGERLTA